MEDERKQFFLWGVTISVGAAVLLIIALWTSPLSALAWAVAAVGATLALARPRVALGLLLAYLPLEPFVLKWVHEDWYGIVRYAPEIGLYVLAAGLAFRIATGRLAWRHTRVDLPLLALLVVMLASVVINAVPLLQAALGVRMILRFVLLLCVTVLLAPSARWIRTMCGVMAAVVGLQVMLGLAQMIGGASVDAWLLPSERRLVGGFSVTEGVTQFWDAGTRVFGTLGRYDQLGTWLALMLLVALAIRYEFPDHVRTARRIAGAVLAAGVPLLIMTQSRSSWFGFLLGAGLIAIVLRRDQKAIAAAGTAAVLLALFLGFSGIVVHRLSDDGRSSLPERFLEAFSFDRWRGEYYGYGRTYWIAQTVTRVVPASPLFGHGPGTYGGGAVAATGYAATYDRLGLPFGVYGTSGQIDGSWMSLWGEIGTLGLLAFIGVLLAAARECVRAWRGSRQFLTKMLALAACGMMVSVSVNAVFASMWEVRTLAPYLWVVLGLVLARWYDEQYAHSSRS